MKLTGKAKENFDLGYKIGKVNVEYIEETIFKTVEKALEGTQKFVEETKGLRDTHIAYEQGKIKAYKEHLGIED
jgi:hypothetical protein